MQIKALAIGDGYVYLMEGSSKVKFYVLAHNYESGLNGKGRTLFCRESPVTKGARATDNRSDNANWPLCLECLYYKATYSTNFTTTVKSWIGSTKIYYDELDNPYNNSTINGINQRSANFSFFAISSAELGTSRFGGYSNSDGTTLSTAARTRLAAIYRSYGTAFWTRSPGRNYTDHRTDSDGDSTYYFGNGLYIYAARPLKTT